MGTVQVKSSNPSPQNTRSLLFAQLRIFFFLFFLTSLFLLDARPILIHAASCQCSAMRRCGRTDHPTIPTHIPASILNTSRRSLFFIPTSYCHSLLLSKCMLELSIFRSNKEVFWNILTAYPITYFLTSFTSIQRRLYQGLCRIGCGNKSLQSE